MTLKANKPDAVNPAMALWLTIEHQWRRVTDLDRADRTARNPLRGVLLFVMCVTAGCASKTASIVQSSPCVEYRFSLGLKDYDCVITRDQVAATPKWRANRGNPPLPARKAVKLATATIRKLPENGIVPDRGDIRLVEIGDEHWFYMVEFTDIHSPIAGLPVSVPIAVLMDGTVISPRPRQ